MKLKQIFNKYRLNDQGISHLLVPLLVVLVVAVGGTYLLVASHAQTPKDKKATCISSEKKGSAKVTACSAKSSKVAKSKILAYSGGPNGRYTGIHVTTQSSTNQAPAEAKCQTINKGPKLGSVKSVFAFSKPYKDDKTKKYKYPPLGIVCTQPAAGSKLLIAFTTVKKPTKSNFVNSVAPTELVFGAEGNTDNTKFYKECIFVHYNAGATLLPKLLNGVSQRQKVPFDNDTLTCFKPSNPADSATSAAPAAANDPSSDAGNEPEVDASPADDTGGTLAPNN